jgi:CBS domain-containing protein
VAPEITDPKGLSMTTARDIMTSDTRCIGEDDTLIDAARMMRELDVGALPICGNDDRLRGMLTDRDIVVKCLADGGDPTTVRSGDLAQGKPVTVGADDDIEVVLATMSEHAVRRLPVIDGHDLVGIVSQADVALNVDESRVGEVLAAISD